MSLARQNPFNVASSSRHGASPSAVQRVFGQTPVARTPRPAPNTNTSGSGPPRPKTLKPPGHRRRRPRRIPRIPRMDVELGIDNPPTERPPIPSALAPSGEVETTPLPILPMIVLSITMLGEFLSANVSTPFLLPMVKGFGVFNDEGTAAYWTGILVSCFFVTQFLTSLLWATVAEKHGVRAVLFSSLLGTSLTCCLFGTSTTLSQAIVIRLLQGVFAGAIGVGRGNIAVITDPTNEGRAYAILGFCWGLGGVTGAIVGGSFETPAKKFPGLFSSFPLFIKYPYLLPCMIASAVTFSGGVMSLFLSYNGGPRQGAIRLPPEKLGSEDIVSEPTTTTPSLLEAEETGLVDGLKSRVTKKLSGYFTKKTQDGHLDSPASPVAPSTPIAIPSSLPNSHGGNQNVSRTRRSSGSAYGYSASTRSRLASHVSQRLAGKSGSLASTVNRLRADDIDDDEAPTANDGASNLNFAQRLLMANENAVTNIADLWVAAAMNVENENPFESDYESDGEDPFLDDESISGPPERHDTLSTRTPTRSRRPSNASIHGRGSSPSRSYAPSYRSFDPYSDRRGPVPSIFSHVGVREPQPAAVSRDHLPLHVHEQEAHNDHMLPTISESRPLSTASSDSATIVDTTPEKQPSTLSQLPLLIILQYGVLALHSTTHDQVFLSYLVSDYSSGGLNLKPGNFAQLIALMSLAQIAYQFYLYPNMGPPRGRFSHLTMYRIGCLLFIPSYLTVIFYRPLASGHESGSVVLMAALALSTALRYCGMTFAYTAISILLNYMAPPHLLGLANGIAQSIVSLARFVGPILGGLLWSISVEKDPSGYPLGFVVVAGTCALAVMHSYAIR